MLACFSRVAQSCSLLEMGTFPFLVSERLQLTFNIQQLTFPVLPLRREGRRGSLRPRQIDRTSCEADAIPGRGLKR